MTQSGMILTARSEKLYVVQTNTMVSPALPPDDD